jgi:phospholipid N-methyltransferase
MTCNFTAKEDINVDHQIMEIEIDVLDLAATLAAQRGHPTSEYILCPARLSSFSPENRLRLLQAYFSRLRLQKRLAR